MSTTTIDGCAGSGRSIARQPAAASSAVTAHPEAKRRAAARSGDDPGVRRGMEAAVESSATRRRGRRLERVRRSLEGPKVVGTLGLPEAEEAGEASRLRH